MELLNLLFETIISKMIAPNDVDLNTNIEIESNDDIEFFNNRELLKKILSNLIFFNDEYYYEKISNFIYDVINNVNIKQMNQIEFALYLHLCIPEFFSKNKLSQFEKNHGEIVQNVFIIIIKSNLISMNFPIIIIINILNVLIRYSTLNFYDNLEVFTATEEIFVSKYGIFNSNAFISDRSCYLLSKLLKAYRKDFPEFIYTKTLPILINLFQSLKYDKYDVERKLIICLSIIHIIFKNKTESNKNKFDSILISIIQPILCECQRLLSLCLQNNFQNQDIDQLVSNLDIFNHVLRSFKSQKDINQFKMHHIMIEIRDFFLKCLYLSVSNMNLFANSINVLKSYIEFVGISTISLQKSLFDVSSNLNVDQLILIHPLVISVLPLLKNVTIHDRNNMLSCIVTTCYNFFAIVQSNPEQICGQEELYVYKISFFDLFFHFLSYGYYELLFNDNFDQFLCVVKVFSIEALNSSNENVQKSCFLILEKLSFLTNVEKYFESNKSLPNAFYSAIYEAILNPCVFTLLDANFNKLSGTHINSVFLRLIIIICRS